MKELTQKQEEAVKKLEEHGDMCLEKDTFEGCLSALDAYANAQAELYRSANDENMLNAKPYPYFNSENVSYKAWYARLNDKMSRASSAMADPKMAKK